MEKLRFDSMQAEKNSLLSLPVLTQSESNTTLWIGHLAADPTDHIGGQTFVCPSHGQIDNIQLYAATVQCPGEMRLTFHEFNAEKKTWGPVLAETIIPVEKTDDHCWIRFNLTGIELKQGVTYGFRVQSRNAMVGLGEAACDNLHPFTFGHEWSADSTDQQGHYYSYFSLAFKVEMRS